MNTMEEVIQVNTCGLNFIIFQKEIASIIENKKINHLPLSEKCIAGVSQINGRVLTFLNFSECIGLKNISEIRESNIIMLSEEEIAGFAVSGEFKKTSIPEENILQLHPYIKNDIINKILISDQVPIPIVNIINLFEYIKMNYMPFRYIPVFEYKTDANVDKTGDFYIVKTGVETFAIPSQVSGKNPERCSKIVPLPILPSFILGISFYDNSPMPIIDSGIRMGLKENSESEMMLPVDIDGNVGIVFDSLKYDHKVNSRQVLLLPPAVQTGYMRYAVNWDNYYYPVVEPDGLLESFNEISLHERYDTDSPFSWNKAKESIHIKEIQFAEAVHAVPEIEVEDVIQFKEYFKIPNTKSIIAGITDYNSELLPVIDPAACYGLRSSPDESWKMILVKKGNFRCFVLTERVYDTKEIQVKDQREFPVKLEHDFVYLCYPDADNEKIKLVLNIKAIALYFEEDMADEISGIFLNRNNIEIQELSVVKNKEDIKQEDVETQSYLNQNTDEELFEEISIEENEDKEELQDEISEEIEVKEVASEITETDNTEPETGEEEIRKGRETEEGVPEEGEELKFEEDKTIESVIGSEFSEFTEGENLVEDTSDIEEATHDENIDIDEDELLESSYLHSKEMENEINDNEEEKTNLKNKAEADQEEISETTAQKDETEGEDMDFIPLEEEPAPVLEENEQKIQSDQQEFNNKSEESELNTQENEVAAARGDTTDTFVSETIEQDAEKEKSPDTVFSDDKKFAVQSSITRMISSTPNDQLIKVESKSRQSRRFKLIIGIILIFITIIVLLIVIYFPNKKNQISSSISQKPEKHESIIKTKQKISKDNQEVQLENKKITTDEYIYKIYNVKKGDTLYEITESFTGDGFDYPEVAKDNDIKDPDLIFPKQTIKIKVKKDD